MGPTSVAVPSKARVRGRSIAGIVGSNPAGGIDSVSCECCVLSGRDLCEGLITRPEEFHRMWSWKLDNDEVLTQKNLGNETECPRSHTPSEATYRNPRLFIVKD